MLLLEIRSVIFMQNPTVPDQIHILITHLQDNNNFGLAVRKLCQEFRFVLFRSMEEMLAHKKTQNTKIYRLMSNETFVRQSDHIRALSFRQKKFIVFLGDKQSSHESIPKPLMAYIQLITNHFDSICSFLLKGQETKTMVGLPHAYMFYQEARGFLEQLSTLLRNFDTKQLIKKFSANYPASRKVMFVCDIKSYSHLYKMVIDGGIKTPFGFILLCEYGNHQQIKKRFSENKDCQVSIFGSRQSLSNWFLTVVNAQKSKTKISVQDIHQIYNVGVLSVDQNEYLTVRDIWARATLSQALGDRWINQITMILIKEQRLPELSLLIGGHKDVSITFVQKGKLSGSELQIQGSRNCSILLVLTPQAKDVLRAFQLQQYQQRNLKAISDEILHDDADSHRVRRFQRVILKSIPVFKLFNSTPQLAVRLSQIRHPQFNNILSYRHMNWREHTKVSKDFVIIAGKLEDLRTGHYKEALPHAILVVDTQDQLSQKFTTVLPSKLVSYIQKQTRLQESLKHSGEVIQRIGIFVLHRGLEPEMFHKKLTSDLRNTSPKTLIEMDLSILGILQRILLNKRQVNLVVWESGDQALKLDLQAKANLGRMQNIYYFQWTKAKSSFQQLFALEYGFVQKVGRMLVEHNLKLEKDSPDYINIRIFGADDLPIVQFIEQTISKRKLFRYDNCQELYSTMKEFMAETKEVIIMMYREWSQDLEQSLRGLYESRLLNFEVILINNNSTYFLKTFKKPNPTYYFLVEDQLRLKVQAFKSIKEQEEEANKAEAFNRQLQYLLLNQPSVDVLPSFDQLSINSFHFEVKQSPQPFESKGVQANQTQKLGRPSITLINSESEVSQVVTLARQKDSRLVPSCQNMLSEIQFDDYQLGGKTPFIKESTSTCKTIKIPPQKSKKKGELKQTKRSAKKSKDSLLVSSDRKIRSSQYLKISRSRGILEFKSTTDLLNSKADPRRETVAPDGQLKKLNQLVVKHLSIRFHVYKKATSTEQAVKKLMKNNKLIEMRTFSKYQEVEGKLSSKSELAIVIMDKSVLKAQPKTIRNVILFYNCLKKKSQSQNCFNFQTVYEVDAFIQTNFKRQSQRSTTPSIKTKDFHLVYKAGVDSLELLSAQLVQKFNCHSSQYFTGSLFLVLNDFKEESKVIILSMPKVDQQVKFYAQNRPNVSVHLLGQEFRPFGQKLQPKINNGKMSNQVYGGGQTENDIGSSYKKVLSQRQTVVRKFSPAKNTDDGTLIPVSIIYVFSSIKVSSLGRALSSLGFEVVFLRPEPACQIVAFSEMVSKTQWIIVNLQQEQNYDRVSLSKPYNITLALNIQLLISEIKSKIIFDLEKLPSKITSEVKDMSKVYYHKRASQFVQSHQNDFPKIEFTQTDLPKGSYFNLSKNEEYKLQLYKGNRQSKCLVSTTNQHTLHQYISLIHSVCAEIRLPPLRELSVTMFFYQGNFGPMFKKSSIRSNQNIVVCDFHMKDYDQIQKCLSKRNITGVFLVSLQNLQAYKQRQVQNVYFIPITSSPMSTMGQTQIQVNKVVWALARHHNVLPSNGFNPEFTFIKNGIDDLFQMEEEAETNLIDSRLSESRMSRSSSNRSLQRSSSLNSRFPLLNKQTTALSKLVVLSPHTTIQELSLHATLSQTRVSVGLIGYSTMQDVYQTIRSHKANQQYLIIFSHFNRLSQQVQELISSSRMIVVVITKKASDHILKSSNNFVYVTSQGLAKLLQRVMAKMQENIRPLNVIMNSEITQLITPKFGQHSSHTTKTMVHMCYEHSERLRTQYKPNEYYFVYCKGDQVDKKILRKNVYIFKDVAFLKYAFFKIFKNYFLVKLKEWYKQTIVLPHKTHKPVYLSEYVPLKNIPPDSFIVAPKSRSHELSRFKNTLIYETKEQRMTVQNLLQFRPHFLECEQNLPEIKKVLIYYHENCESMIHLLKGLHPEMPLIRFRTVSEIPTEKNLKISVLLCKVQDAPLLVDFISRHPMFKLILLNLFGNRNPFRESLQLPTILASQSEMVRYFANQLKLLFVTVFLDKKYEDIKSQLASRIKIKHQIYIVTGLEMNSRNKEVVGVGFYISDANILRENTGIKFIPVGQDIKDRDSSTLTDLVNLIEDLTLGKQDRNKHS